MVHVLTRRTALVGATMLAAAPAFGAAGPALTIVANGQSAALTLDDLRALPQHVVTTHTEFTDGLTTFVGPLARDVLTPPDGATVALMRAINDYEVEIPLEDFRRFDVVLALSMNGTPLSRRDNGPIWVMYPLDDDSELASPVYINRLIWQLKSVTFR
jgi:hypothetical protein